ncbi:hypothetical protein E4U58_000892, partial [Claviceps cyperi]
MSMNQTAQRTPTAASESGQNDRHSAKIPDPAQLDVAVDLSWIRALARLLLS